MKHLYPQAQARGPQVYILFGPPTDPHARLVSFCVGVDAEAAAGLINQAISAFRFEVDDGHGPDPGQKARDDYSAATGNPRTKKYLRRHPLTTRLLHADSMDGPWEEVDALREEIQDK